MKTKLGLIIVLIFNTFLRIGCSRCNNIPPGLEKLSRGVDITKLDLLPLENNEDSGFARKIISFSCDNKEKWTSPYNADTVYDLPDQIETINAIPGGVLDAKFSLHTSFTDVKMNMASKVGVDLLDGMFSSSFSYKRFQNTIGNDSKKVSEVDATFSGIEVDFHPFWELTLSSSVLRYIEKVLPANYSENPSRYEDFFRYFGTHYFSRGKFGGIFRISFEMQNSLLSTMTKEEIEFNSKNIFLSILKTNGAFSGSVESISHTFKEKTRHTTRFYGGNANLFNVETWSNWWSSVPGNPWLFGGHLKPIFELISDGPKKQELLKAYKVYVNKANLSELKRILYTFVGKGRVGEEKAMQFLNKTNQLLSEKVTDDNEVKTLSKKVANYVITPNWFTSRTELCYKWYPDWDHTQCSASAKTLCAKPNSKTDWYRDDTDNRKGGCRMMWGIMSPASEPWFKQVKLCFKWEKSPGENGDQCGGGAPSETCASIGTYTHVYRDDTNNRWGGCYMYWMLKVPKDSPGWILNTRICFYWYPDGGDNRQCGVDVDRTLCAIANQWTHYYWDDSDNRAGGCRMSWGLITNSDADVQIANSKSNGGSFLSLLQRQGIQLRKIRFVVDANSKK